MKCPEISSFAYTGDIGKPRRGYNPWTDGEEQAPHMAKMLRSFI